MCALIFLFGAAEIYSRVALGLGDSPLSVKDSEIDYLFAPNQKCKRFGNNILYNSFSMRADRNPASLRDGSRRAIVVGDSVANGGALTDHADLASSMVDRWLSAQELGDVWNVSAGSWGPLNYAAYFQRYGTFDATDLFLVVSSHDAWEDDPRMASGEIVGTSEAFPNEKPFFACIEGFNRYFLPKIKTKIGKLKMVNRKVDVKK